MTEATVVKPTRKPMLTIDTTNVGDIESTNRIDATRREYESALGSVKRLKAEIEDLMYVAQKLEMKQKCLKLAQAHADACKDLLDAELSLQAN